jgi:hypothetical protein
MNFDMFFSDLYEFLVKLKDSMIDLAPRFTFASIVFVIGYLLARLIRYLAKKFINNLPRFFNSKNIKNRLYQSNLTQSATHLSNIFFWIILIFTIALITEIIGLPIITSWLGGIVYFLPNILIATVIIFLGVIGGRLAGSIIVSTANKAGIAHGNVIGKIAQYGLLFISLIIAADQLRIEISFLIQIVDIVLAALLFAAALAFGLGAKKSVSNILASYYVHNIYQEGDIIKIDEIEGQIIKINSTSVVLNTKEGQVNFPSKYFSDKKSVLLNKERE